MICILPYYMQAARSVTNNEWPPFLQGTFGVSTILGPVWSCDFDSLEVGNRIQISKALSSKVAAPQHL